MQTFVTAVNALASLIIAIGVVWNIYLTHRTHQAVNSKMDKLLAVTSESAKAKGVVEGREEMKEEIKEEIKEG